ncbi:uncharacterized protein FOMMEDRAFT_160312 [Fomitiporia mediterranea MF3/22]|uniref:uncharacterized protein n=1 Tax=Fomitiporia mediterranea (strain MF3/22) TaxID=694068 RepID=UPI0004409A27|nr:uncharacterized protein FOMMEDRAFT_160312 [Fomitiporia mediterranea MF3/22]EJC99861.1 hypothetical protein FOMMEDRAFT_160312 [Fomitiporia mediterranea MF3/22]
MNAMHNLRVIRVDGLQWDCSLHSKIPNLCVEICHRSILRKTRAIKDKSHVWNETLSFPAADASTVVSVKVLHKSTIPLRDDTCIGSINIELSELSRRCVNGPAHLPLDAHAGKNYGKPTVVVHLLNATITSVDLSHDVNTAIEAIQGLGHSTGSGDLVEQSLSILDEERDLGKSILALVEKTGVLVNIIDKLSTLHPYVNVAWQLASALYKAISHQIETDQKLVGVVHAMEDAFNFVTDADSLPDKTERRLKHTIERLLQQTIECCRFILHYTSRNFPFNQRSMTARMLQMSRLKIDDFTERFLDLKTALDLDIGLHTAFVSARISDDVEDICMLCLITATISTDTWTG